MNKIIWNIQRGNAVIFRDVSRQEMGKVLNVVFPYDNIHSYESKDVLDSKEVKYFAVFSVNGKWGAARVHDSEVPVIKASSLLAFLFKKPHKLSRNYNI